MDDYSLGFRDVTHEVADVQAEVEGCIPAWLQGSLLRNGPGSWTAGKQPITHWFDGQAMLHHFRMSDGRVRYSNRYLCTPDRVESTRTGRVSHPGFAIDPCRSLFKKVMSLFVSELGANANIHLTRLGDRFLALTETPLAVEFDPHTLATLGLFDYGGDGMPGQMTSAHPIPSEDGLYNFTVKLGARSRYHGYRILDGLRRRPFASHIVEEPAYLHSCGLSARELILVGGPLVVKPLDLLWRDRPYIQNYRWRPELGTMVVCLDRQTGASRSSQGPPMFVFHQVNAFYEQDQLCVDVLAYPDPSVIQSIFLDALAQHAPVPMPTLQRLRIGPQTFSVESRSPVKLELPRLSPGRQGLPYRYVYGVTQRHSSFVDGLVKLDVNSGAALFWTQEGCFAGEPVPVPTPDAEAEDDAVVLSVVLDSQRAQSFLLFLDARNWQELARAYVPGIVPFGFHGNFFPA